MRAALAEHVVFSDESERSIGEQRRALSGRGVGEDAALSEGSVDENVALSERAHRQARGVV